MGVVVAIDPGTRYIGIAVSNPEQTLALPLTIIDRRDTKDVVAAILDLVRDRQAETLVVGRPLSLRNRPIPMTEHAEKLATQLRARTDIPVTMVDERLSTVAATRDPHADRPDASAAALILETYLGRQKNPS